MRLFVIFVSGLLFGLGLCLAGMTDPQKVLAFLDLAGPWDPSLALTMMGALAVAGVAFRFTGRASASAPLKHIDDRLYAGAAIFGIGWGLVGLCPGSALANLGFFDAKAVLFVLAMASGARAATFLISHARRPASLIPAAASPADDS